MAEANDQLGVSHVGGLLAALPVSEAGVVAATDSGWLVSLAVSEEELGAAEAAGAPAQV